MKPSLNQDFHGLLVEMFRKLVVKPSENKISYILKLVEKNQVDLRQEEVQPVLEGLWKLWSEYFWLNPWLFEKHVPDAAIKAKNHQQKATRERRTAASQAARDLSSTASTSQQRFHGSHPPVATRPDGTRKRRNSHHSEHSQDGADQNNEPPQKRHQLGHVNDSTSYDTQHPSHRPGKADSVRYVPNQDRESPDLNSSSRQPLHYQQDYHSHDGHARSENHYQSVSAYPTRSYPHRPNAYHNRMTHPEPNQRAYIHGNSAPISAVATSSHPAYGEMRRPPLPSHHPMLPGSTAYQYHEPLLSPIPQSPMHPPSHSIDTNQYHHQTYRAESQSPSHSLEPPVPSPRQDQVSLPSIHQITSISSSTSPRGSIRSFRVPSSSSQDESSMLRSPNNRSPSAQ
ncbi:hypothetical protein BKA69DRAFT_1081432 [Paraphysoderma sedebokerense]|nr:hypothetical protein BKA69DRAFT_1081432 [Paraphysoderma sedebokerense]